MSAITNATKIPKDVETNDDLDFQHLIQLGIAYIEAMGGGLWTDLNDSDSGKTMLDILCYAITDLGARLDLPIEDLLASKNDPTFKDQFYDASEILPSCPVSELDYRKLFLDIPGIRNCWLSKAKQTIFVNCRDKQVAYKPFNPAVVPDRFLSSYTLKGLNCLLVDYDLDAKKPDETDVDEAWINARIMEKYHENRNLCEDLVEIKQVEEYPISVCANIDIENTTDQNLIHAKILDAIDAYFTPRIRHYSLKEMVDKGFGTDEIFDGPLLEKGFIDTQELSASALRSEVRLSDLVRIMMEIEGVKVVSDISIDHCNATEDASDWLICIPENHKPVLAPTKDVEPAPENDCDLKSVFNYKKEVLPVLYSYDAVLLHLNELEEARKNQSTFLPSDNTLTVKQGTYRNVGETTTIQNDFPDTYGINRTGLSPTASVERKAQAVQLKGYLSFFDQVLGSYFAHLENVRSLFSMNSGTSPTYFTQAIKDLKGFEDLVQDYPTNNDALLGEKLIGFLDDNITRRNELLDHLLARFAEKFSEYTFLMHEIFGNVADQMAIQSKEQFLAEYVEISSARSKGYNCTGPDVWNTDNVSGTQKRMARLTGIRNYFRRNLAQSYTQFTETPAASGFYSWSVTDATETPVLQSVKTNADEETAAKHLCFVVQQLMDASIPQIHKIDPLEVENGSVIDNILIHENAGVWSFSVINVKIPENPDPLNRLFANGLITYNSWEELSAGLVEFLTFVKNEFIEEGLFLVEHILLRPDVASNTLPGGPVFNPYPFLPICEEDCESGCSLDNYSFRVSVILPGVSQRFSNPDFRAFVEMLIREELPSHIVARICWVGLCKMETGVDADALPEIMPQLEFFEKAYQLFLEERSTGPVSNNTLNKFNHIFMDLHTVYASGRLHDCETEDLTGKIILGRTNL